MQNILVEVSSYSPREKSEQQLYCVIVFGN